MNRELYEQARRAYSAGNYAEAYSLFSTCLDQRFGGSIDVGDIGNVYHQAGNCLMKMDRIEDALEAYAKALIDEGYDAIGSLNYNIGVAYSSKRDWPNAAKFFEAATIDDQYSTPYKAFFGMGNSLLKMGKSVEAGVAFRNAALDPVNPDPTKALTKLGLCFMALGRPEDAIVSYENCLTFPMDSIARNKIYANLGQAQVSAGKMAEAVQSFEKALEDKTYFLNDSASVDYQRAITVMAQRGSEDISSGDMAQQMASSLDTSGLDIATESPLYDSYSPSYQRDQAYENSYGAQYPYGQGFNGDPNQPAQAMDDRFFTASDEEIEKWSKGESKKGKKKGRVGIKILIIFIILLILAAAAGAFAYLKGYGYPSPEVAVSELFSNPDENADKLCTSDLLSSENVKDIVVQDSSLAINGTEASMGNATVYTTAHTSQGGEVPYKATLVRSGIGWKVSAIDFYFASQNS